MRRQRILLVEDNPDDEELLLHALRAVGDGDVSVAVARDGSEALRYLLPSAGEQEHPMPTVVFMDIKLPKVTGLEVLERLRRAERTRFLPIVILSSSDCPEDVAGAYARGANSYVQKPVDFSDLTATLRELGRYWLHINRSMVVE